MENEDMHEDLRRVLARAVLARASALDEACIEALTLGCGVSVVGDALTYLIRADIRVPMGMIWECPTDAGIDVAALSYASVPDGGASAA